MSQKVAGVPADVLERFSIDPSVAVVQPLGSGHIHATFLVRGGAEPLVLQRINEEVFPDPGMLDRNAGRIASALERASGRGDYALEWAAPLADRNGATLVETPDGPWRAMRYVGGTYSIDEVDDSPRARRGAQAFGLFCRALATEEPEEFESPIPGFHDFEQRLARFEQAVREDAAGRAISVAEEIDFCRSRETLRAELKSVQQSVPQRVCHNDSKINNLLFDANDHRVRAVVDLDTCMPGWWMHDFGDIVRTFCSPEPEDSVRLDRVRVREDIFAAVCEGFTGPLGSHLAPGERESLWWGALGVTFILGVRFFTDHLEGDRYFPVARPDHNLDRARNQFRLHQDLSDRDAELRPLLG